MAIKVGLGVGKSIFRVENIIAIIESQVAVKVSARAIARCDLDASN